MLVLKYRLNYRFLQVQYLLRSVFNHISQECVNLIITGGYIDH